MQERGIGIDIIRIERVERAARRQSFCLGAFTEAELEYYKASGGRAETLAGIYSAKEAVIKAAGNLPGLRRLKEIDICHDKSGKPYVRLGGLAAVRLAGCDIAISITHDSGFAMSAAELIPRYEAIAKRGEGMSIPAAIDFSDKEISRAFSELSINVSGSKINAGAGIMLPVRKENSHKGDYGRVRIIAGSREMPGAALMAAESAAASLKSGAGLVTICVPESMAEVFGGRVKEAMLYLLPDGNGRIRFSEQSFGELAESSGSIAIGMGMGSNAEIGKILTYLSGTFGRTLIIDADALGYAGNNAAAIRARTGDTILTPHEGEFRRLFESVLGRPVNEMADWEEKGAETALLAELFGAIVLRKSSVTIISDGKDIFYNTTGTPAMAKGGSGDVLSGMIAAVACRLPALDAALYSCYHFGLAGRRAAERLSEESVLASDIILEI